MKNGTSGTMKSHARKQTKTGGATAQLTWGPGGGAIVSGGGEYVRHDVDIRIFEAPNEFFPDVAEDLTEHVGTKEENAGVFGQVWWPATERLALTGTLRFDHVHIPFSDFLDASDSGTSDFNEPSGLIGLDYLLDPGTSVFASYWLVCPKRKRTRCGCGSMAG